MWCCGWLHRLYPGELRTVRLAVILMIHAAQNSPGRKCFALQHAHVSSVASIDLFSGSTAKRVKTPFAFISFCRQPSCPVHTGRTADCSSCACSCCTLCRAYPGERHANHFGLMAWQTPFEKLRWDGTYALQHKIQNKQVKSPLLA